MSESITPEWRYLKNLDDLEKLIELSNRTPVIVFRYHPDRKKDHKLKKALENEWEIVEPLPAYLLDESLVQELSLNVCERLEVDNISPIILLIIEGEVIYEEFEKITARNIKLAIRIVKRTYKWMEMRKKKAPGKPKA